MGTKTKISLSYGYRFTIDEDDTLTLKIETADGILEFDGKNGNLIEASSFERFDEEYRDTLNNLYETAMELLTDWDVNKDTATAICDDLTPWFEKYAMSEEEKVAETIAKIEKAIAYRREDIARKMRNINADNKLIAEANERITDETERVLKLHKDIESYLQTISALKASLKAEKFISVDPEYTGGGIYVFTGALTDGNFFMADTSFFDVRILNADPNIPIDISDEEAWKKYGTTADENAWASVEWQEEHLVKDLKPTEAVAFFKEMLGWVKRNDPDGNYLGSDMDYFMNELENLHGDWR